jgi:predicted dehydrogenase
MRPRVIRWGVLGVAKIATARVIPPVQRAAPHCAIDAIASRDIRKAEEAAARLGIPRAYGSYEALLADPDIDAVYNPLPNHLHVPWTIRAAEAGKHVLCEKPIALSAAEARTLLGVRDRTGVRIQEAFMIRTHPQWLRAKSLVEEGRLGEVRAMTGFFSYFNADPGNVRNVREYGGGGLLDIGCYLVNTSRFIFGAEPLRIAGTIECDPATGIDRLTSMLLDFDGRHAIGTCSTQALYYQRIQIVGTRGRLEIEIPFNAPSDRSTRIFLDPNGDPSGTGIEMIAIQPCDQFALQFEEFSTGILESRPQRVPLEDAVANMACIDAVFRSAESGRWEAP